MITINRNNGKATKLFLVAIRYSSVPQKTKKLKKYLLAVSIPRLKING